MAELELGQHCGVADCRQLGSPVVWWSVKTKPEGWRNGVMAWRWAFAAIGDVARDSIYDIEDREEEAESSGLSNGGDAGFLEHIASPPVDNPYSKDLNCPVPQQSGSTILSGLTINAIFSITDFLPFVCDGCSGVFCLQHRSRDAHGCSEVNIRNSSVKPDQHRSYPCSYKDCNGKELLPVLCPYCEKHFCLRHRHQSDHECDKLDTPRPRMAATQQLVKHIIDSKTNKEAKSKTLKGAKNSETAAKVALMKMKMHACGDKSLPQTERIYFQVFLPKGNKEKSKPMFFCSKWSIGKVVDFAASLASLKNDNNKSTSQKLRLCHTASGEALPFEHTLETWLSDKNYPLYNGGNIILEYLDNDVLFIEDTESYFS